MLALLLSTLITCPVLQAPQVTPSMAVAVKGDTELSPANALASAELRVDEHLREVWQERAQRAVARLAPFWMPQILSDYAVQRWLANLSVQDFVTRVDRDDCERNHEFGCSYQTTLWIAEKPGIVERTEACLRDTLRRLERTTALKVGGIAAGWGLLALLLGWLDRLSRGYMTVRLRLIGILGGVLMPAAIFLV